MSRSFIFSLVIATVGVSCFGSAENSSNSSSGPLLARTLGENGKLLFALRERDIETAELTVDQLMSGEIYKFKATCKNGLIVTSRCDRFKRGPDQKIVHTYKTHYGPAISDEEDDYRTIERFYNRMPQRISRLLGACTKCRSKKSQTDQE